MRVVFIPFALVFCAAVTAQQLEWWTPPEFGSAVATALAFDPTRARTVMVYGSGTWEWDGAVWRQRSAANPMGIRHFPGFAHDPDRGVTVLFAGQSLSGGPLGDTWEWDGASWTRVVTATAPSWRSYTAMAYDPIRQRMLLFGGNASFPQDDTWEYDGADWTRLFPATVPSARERHTLAHDVARAVTVMFGGLGNNTRFDETWEWNGSDWTQRTPATRPAARMNHTMAYDARRQRTVVFGGIAPPTNFDDTWEWDGASWTQVQTGQPRPATGPTHEMCYDSVRGEIVECEVTTGGAPTWTYDGTSWSIAAPSADPGVRVRSRYAYDAERAEIVTFLGGTAPPAVSETWVHRTGQWLPRAPSIQPAARDECAMAFDPVSRRVLLFGGNPHPHPVAETWLWDGANWQQAAPATSPPARSATALASDAARGRVVMFGGQGTTGELGDTWEWDGTTWLQRSPATVPPSRKNQAMSFDPTRNVTIMFGGGDFLSPPVLGDHWEWDGTDWTPILGTPLPTGRAEAGMVFDTTTQTTVLVGGYYHLGVWLPVPRNDAWQWNGTQWTQLAIAGPQPWPRLSTPLAHDADTGRSLIHSGEGTPDTWLLGPTSTAAATDYGSGCAGSFGTPALSAIGLPVSGNRHFEVQASSLTPGGLVFFVFGFQPANSPLPGGCTALLDPVAFVGLFANARGAARYPLPLPASPAFQGLQILAQAAAVDPGGAYPGVGALSAGLRIRIDR